MTALSVPLVVRRIIHAPLDRVFEAFTSAEALSHWFVPNPEVSVDVLAFDFTAGGSYRLRYTMQDERQTVVSGVYEDITPLNRIVMTWIWEAPDPLADIPMRVTFELAAQNTGTEIVITHEGIPSDGACSVHQDGWVGSLSSLERYLALQTSGQARTEKRTSPNLTDACSPGTR